MSYGRWAFLFATASMVIVANSVVGGAIVALAVALGEAAALPVATAVGIAAGLTLAALGMRYEYRRLAPVIAGPVAEARLASRHVQLLFYRIKLHGIYIAIVGTTGGELGAQHRRTGSRDVRDLRLRLRAPTGGAGARPGAGTRGGRLARPVVPEVGGREALTHAGYLLSCSERMTVVNGIAQIWGRGARATYGAGLLLADAYPGRHLLGETLLPPA